MKISFRTPAARSVLVMACFTAMASVTVTAQGAQIQLADGIIVSSDQSAAYVMEAQGGLSAHAIRDGRVQWRSDAAARPVMVRNNVLLVQRAASAYGELPLALLDAGDGSVLTSTTLTIPANVRASIDHELDSRFVMHTESAVADDEAVWRYEYQKRQGVRSINQAAPLKVSGVVAADFAARQVTAFAKAAPPPAVRSVLASRAPVASADDRSFVSEDGRHTMMSARNVTGDLTQRYQWRIFNARGIELGQFASPVSYAPFVVINGTALFVTPEFSQMVAGELVDTPMSLRAFNLRRGAEAWNTAVRDTQYRGPFPP